MNVRRCVCKGLWNLHPSTIFRLEFGAVPTVFLLVCHFDAYDGIMFAVVLQIMYCVYHQLIRRMTNAVTGELCLTQSSSNGRLILTQCVSNGSFPSVINMEHKTEYHFKMYFAKCLFHY